MTLGVRISHLHQTWGMLVRRSYASSPQSFKQLSYVDSGKGETVTVAISA